MIPKIIHHIAPVNQNTWHPFWSRCRQSWLRHFPDYTFMLWNDTDELDNLVKNHYPRFWNLYKNLPVHIMRIDFARLCILHKYGGVYADMDIFCYKNFENYMTEQIYFLENATNEYTDAKFENSLMASVPDHQLLIELMSYTQTCFIHFRHRFKHVNNNWRNNLNDPIVNNITGSGMISHAIGSLAANYNISVFECKTFNNRPGSYDPVFFTKHLHTSVWGNEYLNFVKNDLDRLIIIDGCTYACGEVDPDKINELIDSGRDCEIVMNNDFDFYKDYTKGIYLRDNNLIDIQNIVNKVG